MFVKFPCYNFRYLINFCIVLKLCARNVVSRPNENPHSERFPRNLTSTQIIFWFCRMDPRAQLNAYDDANYA